MWVKPPFSTNLVSQNQSAEEDAMMGPFFGLDGQMGSCSPHVDEGDEDVGDAHFGGIQDSLGELGELFFFGSTRG